MAFPLERTHAEAVKTALGTVTMPGSVDTVPVEVGRTPANPGDLYYIVDPMTSLLDHSLAGDHSWARFAYHVRCFAVTWDGTLWLQDEARERLLPGPSQVLSVPDRTLVNVTIELSTSMPQDEDARTEPLFWRADRYRIDTDPA